MSDLWLVTFEVVCCKQMLTIPFGINRSGLWLFSVDESIKIQKHIPRGHYLTFKYCQNLWSWWLIVLMWHIKNPKAEKHTLENLIGWKHTTLSIKCCHKAISARFWDL
jgi:hypothetical protein